MKKFSLIVADDHTIVRNAIEHMLKNTIFEITGSVNNGIELIEFVEKQMPDMAIIDLEMPKMDGYETISILHKKFAYIKIIAFSGFINSQNQQRLIEIGVDGIVSKNGAPSVLITALEEVSQNNKYYSTLPSDVYEKPRRNDKENPLTRREKQILAMIASGKTSKQIAAKLCISQWTVNTHRANIREKLKLHNMSAMVKYAIDNSYILD